MKTLKLRLRYWSACFNYITRDVYDLHDAENAVMAARKALNK